MNPEPALLLDMRSEKAISFFVGVEVLVSVVNDGWSGRPGPVSHQLLLLPFLACFAYLIIYLLKLPMQTKSTFQTPRLVLGSCCVMFEICSVVGFIYEARHFYRFGYMIHADDTAVFLVALSCCALLAFSGTFSWRLLLGVLLAYTAGLWLAIRDFPLNYLRSDMLPVIVWADSRLAAHLNPYATMYVGGRVYDFPYLPGMLVAFLPAVEAGVDVRWTTWICILLLAMLLYRSCRSDRRREATLLLGIFLLSPFLQYRHELYLAPHWLALGATVVLLTRRRYSWAAAAFGVSMALYQLSWVLFPFLALYAWRRGRWPETLKTMLVSVAAMLVIVGPFLKAASQRIANNTVGQWSGLPHALADPINLSFWLTYVVRPSDLKWVQLATLTILFAYCVFRGKCRSLTDTLRWMSAALTIFILMNVLVDGYFYLTLLLMLLMYTYATAGLWNGEGDLIQSPA